jgi:chemotaxis protein methyltransferase CheR
MLSLQPAVFSIITGLVEARAGLHSSAADLATLESRVSPRALELGLPTLLDYYYFLRYDPAGSAELDRLVESLLNHETFLFREPEQLQLLVDTFLDPMIQSGQRPRVWCAAASSGEEIYTLAMLLAERDLTGRVDLLASDLSSQAICLGQAGTYAGRALRAIDGVPAAAKWLEPDGATARVPAALRATVAWKQVNLLAAEQIEALGPFDAILCRNVLIYFSDQTARRVVHQLTMALKADGLLMVGSGESLINAGSALRCEERSGAFFYRKAA